MTEREAGNWAAVRDRCPVDGVAAEKLPVGMVEALPWDASAPEAFSPATDREYSPDDTAPAHFEDNGDTWLSPLFRPTGRRSLGRSLQAVIASPVA